MSKPQTVGRCFSPPRQSRTGSRMRALARPRLPAGETEWDAAVWRVLSNQAARAEAPRHVAT